MLTHISSRGGRPATSSARSTFIHTVYDLLEGMADGRSPRPDFEDSLRNQRVLAAWTRSVRQRRWERV